MSQPCKTSKKSEDIYERVTKYLIDQIEQGGVPPWRCPWVTTGEPAMPFNAQTKRQYNGVNVLLLWMKANAVGFTSNGWMTFNQARDQGGSVKRHAKGSTVLYYKAIEPDDNESEENKRVRFITRCYTLFNLDQIDGIERNNLPIKTPVDDVREAVELTALPYLKKQDIDLLRGGERAYYSPSMDQIRLPSQFESGRDYAATLAHEIAHSTGHKKRLDRFDCSAMRFNKHEKYAFEELVAELCAAFWCAECGASPERTDHASYLDHWLTAFKKDTRFFFKAASKAEKALSYIKKEAGAKNDKIIQDKELVA